MNVIAYGGHAVLVECDGPELALSIALRLMTPALAGVEDVVPAARTVLVCGEQSSAVLAALVDERLREWTPGDIAVAAAATPDVAVAATAAPDDVAVAVGTTPVEIAVTAAPVEIAVTAAPVEIAVTVAPVDIAVTAAPVEIVVDYDGLDLAAVAAAAGLTPGEVVALHSEAIYTVAFCGFAPGFAYLVGLPTELVLARRATPRPMVPAGSVAIAGQFSAVYPTASPGGWHLLGHTDLRMFDPAADRPAVLTPGDRVRFVPR